MKILFEIKKGVYPNTVGGMEIFNYYIIRELAKLTEISYTATTPYNHGYGKFIKTRSIRPTKYLDPLRLGINIIIHKPDVVVISYSEAHAIMWGLYQQILTLLKVPYIVVIHHGKVPSNDDFTTYSKFFQSAKAVVAVSDDIKRNYDSLYNINCTVIPPLVPFEESQEDKKALLHKFNLPEQATLIGMIGTIKDMKNPDTLIRAIASMTSTEKERYNPIVVLAGKGPATERMMLLAKELGIEARTIFLGFIPKNQVGEILKCLDIYVIASDYEGTSVSLIEAMYNSKPILASNVIGIKDTIQTGECLFFDVKNHADLKSKLLELLSDNSLRLSIAKKAKNRFDTDYDYQPVLNQYLKLFE